MVLWLTHLEGSPNTQEKLELLGLHRKGRIGSKMAVAPYNVFSHWQMRWVLLIPPLRGGNRDTERLQNLLRSDSLYEVKTVIKPRQPYSRFPTLQPHDVPSLAREAETNSQLQSPIHTCHGLSLCKVPGPMLCASHVFL